MGRLTQVEFISRINSIRPDVVALEPYVKNNAKIKFMCKTCGNTWDTAPINIFAGSGCPICGRKKSDEKRKLPLKDILKEFQDKKIHMIGEYLGASKKVLCGCDICNHQWEAYPYLIMKGVGCPKCAAKKNGDLYRKSTSQFVEEMKFINLDIEIIGKYHNCDTPIECKCKICNNQFFATPHNLIKGKGCGHCTRSKGEKKIQKYFENNQLVFVPQKKYDDLIGVGGGQLSYDFYLSKYNLLIEYQGQYHDGTANNQSDEQFLTQKEHDKRKYEYALKNNIRLLEIWYYDFDNIEDILKQHLTIQNDYKGEINYGGRNEEKV